MPLFSSGSTTTYGQTVNQVLGLSSTNTTANMMWELDSYSAYAGGKLDTLASSGREPTDSLAFRSQQSMVLRPPLAEDGCSIRE